MRHNRRAAQLAAHDLADGAHTVLIERVRIDHDEYDELIDRIEGAIEAEIYDFLQERD